MSSTPSCQAKNASTSASSSACLLTGLPTPWPARPSWCSRTGRSSWSPDAALQQRRHLAGVQRVDPGVALGRGEQHRRVAGAVDHVVVRRVGVQPGELLGDVGVAVLVGPQPGDEELREAHHVEQRHARTTRRGHRSGRCVRAAPTSSPPFEPPVDGQPLARRAARSPTSQSAAAWKSSNTFCLLARRPAWCHASPCSSPPRRPATAYSAAGRAPRRDRRRPRRRLGDGEAAVAGEDQRRVGADGSTSARWMRNSPISVPSSDGYVTCSTTSVGGTDVGRRRRRAPPLAAPSSTRRYTAGGASNVAERDERRAGRRGRRRATAPRPSPEVGDRWRRPRPVGRTTPRSVSTAVASRRPRARRRRADRARRARRRARARSSASAGRGRRAVRRRPGRSARRAS